MEGRTEIDIIILSYAQNDELKMITEHCISSLMISEDDTKIKFNIIVVESEKSLAPFQYAQTETIYPEEEFGYHRFMNLGIASSSSKYICLCNNDIRFHPKWATELLKAFNRYHDLSSVSPFCSVHHPQMGFEYNNGIYDGYRIRYEVAGWCLFLKRDVLRITGKLDENYEFWCADNDYANTLDVLGLRHALVSSSVVDHLDSRTINGRANDESKSLTSNEFFYLEKKWNARLGEGWQSA